MSTWASPIVSPAPERHCRSETAAEHNQPLPGRGIIPGGRLLMSRVKCLILWAFEIVRLLLFISGRTMDRRGACQYLRLPLPNVCDPPHAYCKVEHVSYPQEAQACTAVPCSCGFCSRRMLLRWSLHLNSLTFSWTKSSLQRVKFRASFQSDTFKHTQSSSSSSSSSSTLPSSLSASGSEKFCSLHLCCPTICSTCRSVRRNA